MRTFFSNLNHIFLTVIAVGSLMFHSCDDEENGGGTGHSPKKQTVTTIYAGIYKGGLSISTDGGTTWETKTTEHGLGTDNILSIFVDERNVLYVGSYETLDFSGGVSISTDGGQKFTNFDMDDGLSDSVIEDIFVDGKTAYVGISTDNGRGGSLAVTTNLGKDWKTKTVGPTSYDVYCVFADGKNIYAGTHQGLFTSTDGGDTWTQQTGTGGPGDNFIDSLAVSGKNIYVGTRSSGLFISTDGGDTWENKTTANGLGNNRVRSIVVVGETIYGGTEDGLSISTDGGATYKTTKGGLKNRSIIDVFVATH